MAIVKRMLLQQTPGIVDDGAIGFGVFRECGAAKNCADLGGRFAGGDFSMGKISVEIGNPIDKIVADGAELSGVHVEE